MKEFREINETLDRCCQLALRQLIPRKQLVLMTDASFQAAGFAVLTEDDPNQKYTSTRKTYAPIAHGSNDLHKDTTIVNIAQLTKPSRIHMKQDSDRTLLNFKREKLGLQFDKQNLLNDARYTHYSRNISE